MGTLNSCPVRSTAVAVPTWKYPRAAVGYLTAASINTTGTTTTTGSVATCNTTAGTTTESPKGCTGFGTATSITSNAVSYSSHKALASKPRLQWVHPCWNRAVWQPVARADCGSAPWLGHTRRAPHVIVGRLLAHLLHLYLLLLPPHVIHGFLLCADEEDLSYDCYDALEESLEDMVDALTD